MALPLSLGEAQPLAEVADARGELRDDDVLRPRGDGDLEGQKAGIGIKDNISFLPAGLSKLA